jgi:hypothetical protein
MVQKIFDNFFPRIEIDRIMCFRRGKALETEMLTRESWAKRIGVVGHSGARRVWRRGRKDRHAFETFLVAPRQAEDFVYLNPS